MSPKIVPRRLYEEDLGATGNGVSKAPAQSWEASVVNVRRIDTAGGGARAVYFFCVLRDRRRGPSQSCRSR